MLFNSFAFAGFMAIVVPAYFLLPQRFRPLLLAVASYYFYMSGHAGYGWLLFTSTAVSYLGGLAMERWPARAARRTTLGLCMAVNLGLLFFFKYADFFIASLNAALHTHVPLLHLALPVGISFFTFQALSYCFDVYRGRFPAERRFDVFAAYKAFFPQLVAGPIERPGNVVPQLKREHRFDYERFVSGLRLMLWGFFKKLVIADRLAVIVKDAYGAPGDHTGLQLLAATYAFSFQIFCDFSAYTDIARGCARILGIELMENFRQPYFARTIPEFWSRWHISLSTWFRDYLYIPLGGNRGTAGRWACNILAVFLVSGLWHGADWKFAIWGLLHAVFFLVSSLLAKVRWHLSPPPWLAWIGAAGQRVLTFHLVAFAWVFFRAGSLPDALMILQRMAQPPWKFPILTQHFGVPDLMISAAAILALEAVQLLQLRGGAVAFLERRPLWVRWPAYYALIFAIVLYAQQGQKDFIYFQF